MTNPRCVLCGDEFKVLDCVTVTGGIYKYYVCHYCNDGCGFSCHIQDTGFHKTKAAALAAIPDRFIKKEDKE